MDVLQKIDTAVSRRVLIFGSLPPENRDLDLLARPAEESVIAAALCRDGFERMRSQWARFTNCSVETVDVISSAGWGIHDFEERRLFEEAISLEGLDHVVRPSPHHTLLILARRLVRGGTLDDKRRGRIDGALGEDPEAWEEAQSRAPGWRASAALVLLEDAYRRGTSVSLADKIQAELEMIPSGSSTVERLRACCSIASRGSHGRVIAFSGLDGSGKTSQATALADSLERLGSDACVVWTRLAHDSSLDAFAKPVKGLLQKLKPTAVERLPGEVRERGKTQDPARLLRRRSPLLTYAWATLVALLNAWSQWRVTRPHIRAGRFVICDRYTLDSAAHLRYRYGEERRFGLQIALIRLISPQPLRAYFLDVLPSTALQRKNEEYVSEQLELQASIYREEHLRLGVRRLNGEFPREQLCAEIARDVWRSSREQPSKLRGLQIGSSTALRASARLMESAGSYLLRRRSGRTRRIPE